jgi:hypothetical protein
LDQKKSNFIEEKFTSCFECPGNPNKRVVNLVTVLGAKTFGLPCPGITAIATPTCLGMIKIDFMSFMS